MLAVAKIKKREQRSYDISLNDSFDECLGGELEKGLRQVWEGGRR